MYKWTVLLLLIIAVLLIYMMSVDGAKKKKKKSKKKVVLGPHLHINYSTSCDEFSKNARFNPYSVVDETWFVFFYWAPPMKLTTYTFAALTANFTKALHKNLDGNVSVPVNWTARSVLMRGDHNNDINFLVERNDRGHYWLYFFVYTEGEKTEPRDVRLKQTSDGRILGFMDCESDMVLAMSRVNEVPPKNRLQDEAARLGYVGRKGKSYLYQGHEWMPTGEADEETYWAPPPEELDEEERNRRVMAEIAAYRAQKGPDADRPPEISPALIEQMRKHKMRFSASSPEDPLEEDEQPEFAPNSPQSETRSENIYNSDAQSNASEQPDQGSLTEAISRSPKLVEENKIDTSDSVNPLTSKVLEVTDKPYKHQALDEQTKNIKYSEINTNDVTQVDDNRYNEISNASDPHILTK